MKTEDTKFYNSIADSYDNGFAHNPGLLKFIEKVNSRLSSSSNILDIGCGTGNPLCSTLAASGHNIVGVDISPRMIEQSQKSVPSGKFVVSDMLHYDHREPAQLDAIFSVFALFRLTREEMEACISKWAGWLSRDGLMCIATMAADDVAQEKVEDRYDPDGLCARNIQLKFMGETVFHTQFTHRGWSELLGQNGLEVVESWTELFVPPKDIDTDDARFCYIIARKQ